MTTFNQILIAALALSPVERAQLIESLTANSSPDDGVAEANRRSDAFDAGEMKGSPWDEVRARARRKAGLVD